MKFKVTGMLLYKSETHNLKQNEFGVVKTEAQSTSDDYLRFTNINIDKRTVEGIKENFRKKFRYVKDAKNHVIY